MPPTVAPLTAGCSTTEVLGPPDRKGINFAAYTAKTTKARQEDITTGNLSAFNVTAFGNNAFYFKNLIFEKSNESSVWESNPEYFWPAFPLTFYAFNTPYGYHTAAQRTGFTINITKEKQELIVYPAGDLANQEDLVAAYAEHQKESDATNAGNSLALRFNHYLTQVIVKAKNARFKTYKVVVESVKIANMAGEGTYTFSGNTMTATAETVNTLASADYTATFDPKELTQTAQEVMTNAGTGKWYLIPQTVTSWDPNTPFNPRTNSANDSHGTYLALKVKITANNGTLKIYPAKDEEFGWMAVPIPSSLKFEQGKKYTVNINFFANNGAGYVDPEVPSELDGDPSTKDNGKKIIGGEIKSDANVNEWDDQNNNIEIYP